MSVENLKSELLRFHIDEIFDEHFEITEDLEDLRIKNDVNLLVAVVRIKRSLHKLMEI